MAQSSLVNTRTFVPLFSIQFLNALNDHILKNAILVMITYQGLLIAGLKAAISVNIATLLFILPFFIFSSYGGKVADMCSKVKLIRFIKFCEIGIIFAAAVGFYTKNINIMVFSLVTMGIHSTFFGPIKYSILPQYISDRKELLLANGYVELGTFVAVLVGQLLGSWYMANHQIEIIVLLLGMSTFVGLILSFRLEATIPLGVNEKLSWNFCKDTIELYKKITVNKSIRNNIHAISWFWAVGVIYTTQLPVFTERYMGGCAHVYSILLAIFSVSIGLGSVICSKFSNGQIRKQYVVRGALGISFFSMILLFVDFHVKANCLNLPTFSSTMVGIVNYLLIFLVGFSAGFYSITCYNELQVISPVGMLSQVIAVNNILNAAYMLLASIICTILLFFINLWWLFIVIIVTNLIFIVVYKKVNAKEVYVG